jgi:hypothetical protein
VLTKEISRACVCMGWQFGSHAVVKRAFARNFSTPSAVSSYFGGPGWKFELDGANKAKKRAPGLFLNRQASWGDYFSVLAPALGI